MRPREACTKARRPFHDDMTNILGYLGEFVKWLIDSGGYLGIFVAMAIESALIPLPSELIMPFAGALVADGKLDFVGISVAGAAGNVFGSWIAYAIGYVIPPERVRWFVRTWGRFLLISEHEMDVTERWLKKWEDAVVFGSRLMPGVRTVVSLPCGFIRMPLVRFTVLTFVGSLIWSVFLGEIGVVMGENWDTLGPYFHAADAVIVAVFLGLGIWYVWHKIKPSNRATA